MRALHCGVQLFRQRLDAHGRQCRQSRRGCACGSEVCGLITCSALRSAVELNAREEQEQPRRHSVQEAAGVGGAVGV